MTSPSPLINGWSDLRPRPGARFAQSVGASPLRRFITDGARVDVAQHAHVRIDGARLFVLAGRPLDSKGQPFALPTSIDRLDAASLLAALHGRFALVVVDAAHGSVDVAVDRFASISMCVARSGTRLCFGDRADAVAASASAGIDPQAVLHYLYFHAIPAPRSLHASVRRLSAAEHHVSAPQHERRRFHWQAQFTESPPADLRALQQQFLEIVRRGVQRAVTETGQVGAFLSGGTDSSTVTGMLRDVLGEAPRAYSIGFEADGYDEMEYARIAARTFGARHREYYVTPDDLVAGIPMVAASYDQPFGNSSALPAYYCAKLARDDGLDRILAGDGGDELFGGNARYAKQKLFDLWFRVPGLLRAAAQPLLLSSAVAATPLLRKAGSYVRQALIPMPQRMETYNLLQRIGPTRLLSPALLAAIDLGGPAREQTETWARSEGASLVNRMLAYDWQYTLADSDLPKVCGTTALAGIEVAFPMLDDELLDFSLRLPSSQKVHGSKLRHFFKEALTGFLPDEIIRKRKHGFGLPFGVWLNRHAGLQALARDSLAGLAHRNVIAGPMLDELDRELRAHAGYYGEMIWILMMLEQWLRVRAPGWRL
jgi:asparagine synthase (glutamine-hydrolysing)